MSKVFLERCEECGLMCVLNIDTFEWTHAAGSIADDNHAPVINEWKMSDEDLSDLIVMRLDEIAKGISALAQRKYIRHERSIREAGDSNE